VISGEHGIGITKLEFLTDTEIAPSRLQAARRSARPLQQGQAAAGCRPARAYTPSLQPARRRVLIMEQSDIGGISDSIKDCLRCGKCKPVCATHVPRANLLYSPRNKILATSLLIEAFLYEEQTRRGVSAQALRRVRRRGRPLHRVPQVRQSVPGGHRLRRRLDGDAQPAAQAWARRNSTRAPRRRWLFLNATDPATIKRCAKGMIDWGYTAQRLAHRIGEALGLLKDQTRHPPATLGRAPAKAQVIHFINKPMPGGLPKKAARALLDIEDKTVVPVIRNPAQAAEDSEAVFYFPGCGSERLFSQVGLATQAMLWHVGAQTVLPPGYLCCGYPQTAGGEADKGQQITTDNRVLFHRVANTLNYLDIKTVIVSCGTCMDQLQKYEFDKIFPGCRLLDIHEYLMEKGVKAEGRRRALHVPRPLPHPDEAAPPLKVVNQLMGRRQVALNDRCCGESGTLAVTRPTSRPRCASARRRRCARAPKPCARRLPAR
jgi:Fe-S oxidoreductase